MKEDFKVLFLIRKVLNALILILVFTNVLLLLVYCTNNYKLSSIFIFFRFDEFIKVIFNLNEKEKETAATIGSSLIIFCAGLFVSWFSNFLKGLRKRNEYRKLLKRFISTLVVRIKEKGENFAECSKTLDVEKGDKWSFKDVTIGYLHEFYQVNYNDFLAAFFDGIENNLGLHNLESESFDEIFKSIATVKGIEDIYTSRLEMFEAKYNNMNEKMNKTREIVLFHFFEMNKKVKTTEISPDIEKYIIKINGRYNEWKSIENHGLPYYFYNSLVAPILEINEIFSDSSRVQNFVPIEFFFALKEAQTDFFGIETIVKTNSKIIESYGNAYLLISNKLNEISKEF